MKNIIFDVMEKRNTNSFCSARDNCQTNFLIIKQVIGGRPR